MISPADIFNYELPTERIAQRPVYPYHQALLLEVDRALNSLSESSFLDIGRGLNSKDILVFNNSRVLPARFFGKLQPFGAGVELLLLEEKEFGVWRCTGKPLKKFKPKSKIELGEGLSAEVIERISPQEVLVKFVAHAGQDLKGLMNNYGLMPIPPYIRGGHSDQQDREDYQTSWAKEVGSVAAPTASLHFTPELLKLLTQQGIGFEFLTLHVGAPSFTALWKVGQDTEITPPGSESYTVDLALLARIEKYRSSGHRIVAVGTTVVRALESMWKLDRNKTCAGLHATSLFIYPGFKFEVVDAMITNFHQPRSTHLLLVEAFLGRPLLEQSYRYALEHDFRFLSYGDGMLIR